MQKRKRATIIMSDSNEESSALESKDGALRGALQPLPNPPSKRPRKGSSKPSGDKPTSKSGKMKPAARAKISQATATASSLPPEIWRLIGEKVNSMYFVPITV
jgi:hypothetical protein